MEGCMVEGSYWSWGGREGGGGVLSWFGLLPPPHGYKLIRHDLETQLVTPNMLTF